MKTAIAFYALVIVFFLIHWLGEEKKNKIGYLPALGLRRLMPSSASSIGADRLPLPAASTPPRIVPVAASRHTMATISQLAAMQNRALLCILRVSRGGDGRTDQRGFVSMAGKLVWRWEKHFCSCVCVCCVYIYIIIYLFADGSRSGLAISRTWETHKSIHFYGVRFGVGRGGRWKTICTLPISLYSAGTIYRRTMHARISQTDRQRGGGSLYYGARRTQRTRTTRRPVRSENDCSLKCARVRDRICARRCTSVFKWAFRGVFLCAYVYMRDVKVDTQCSARRHETMCGLDCMYIYIWNLL